MNKPALVIGGIAVAVIAVVLYMMVGHANSSREMTSAGTTTVTTTGTATGKTVVDRDQAGTRVSPALPGSAGSAVGEYVASGVHVRDHRDPDSTRPPDVPPNIHPENSRKLPPELTQGIAQQVKGAMMQCTRDLPKDARGAGPRLEGQIVVGVKDQKLAISSAALQLRDVSGAAADPTRLCIEQKAVGLAIAAPDQADLDGYTINITFAIP